MKKVTKIFLGFIFLGIVLVILLFGYVYTKLEEIQVKEDVQEVQEHKKQNEQGGELPAITQGIEHVLLIGTDHRENENDARSDAVMLVTLNTVENNIKLTSFARDTYVNIPERGYEKLTHAYAYGEAPLLLQTVQNNFDVAVEHYVAIDFSSFIKVIDLIGGATINIQDIDLKEFNRVSLENYNQFYESQSETFQEINDYGEYTLKGYQVLSYARMRKTDSVFARDERQREIIEQTAEQLMALPFFRYPQLFEEVMPYIETNMSPSTMLKLGLMAFSIGVEEIQQLQFPEEEYSEGMIMDEKGWVLQWDEEVGRARLKDYLE